MMGTTLILKYKTVILDTMMFVGLLAFYFCGFCVKSLVFKSLFLSPYFGVSRIFVLKFSILVICIEKISSFCLIIRKWNISCTR